MVTANGSSSGRTGSFASIAALSEIPAAIHFSCFNFRHSSVNLGAGALDYLGPFHALLADEFAELLGRAAAHGIRADRGDFLPVRRRGDHLVDLGVELEHNGARHANGR